MGRKHIRVGKKLLLADKKWAELKNAQKSWIIEELKSAYIKKSILEKMPLNKEQLEDIVDVIYTKIKERDINISDIEIKRRLHAKLRKWNKVSNTKS